MNYVAAILIALLVAAATVAVFNAAVSPTADLFSMQMEERK